MPDPHREYTALLMRHRDLLWHLCWHHAHGDRDRCLDLLQEVSIALWENIGKLRGDASPRQERAWVKWQARSVFYQIGRQQKTQLLPLNEALADDGHTPGSENEEMQRRETIDDLLATLSPNEQRMIRLYLQGYNGDEIGQQMGISRNNYYQRMHRTIQKMRRMALPLLALLFASAIAIAVVPQWRHHLFGGSNRVDTVGDTIPSLPPTQTAKPSAPHPSDTVAMPTIACRDTITLVPLDCLPPLETFTDKDYPVKLLPSPRRDPSNDLTISVNGNYYITIPGAAGELVRVYDMGGNLVAAQRAGSFCLFNLLPNYKAPFVDDWNRFILQIGNRPPIQIGI